MPSDAPPPPGGPLSRAALADMLADVRAYIRGMPTKPLVVLALAPLLVTLSMRLATVKFARELYASIYRGKTFDPLYYWGWVFVLQAILFYAVPVLVIKLVFKEPLSSFGHRLRPALKLWPLAVLFLGVMIPVTYIASLSPSFKTFYPMYPGSYRGAQYFLTFEAGLFILFFTQEFFFRGFIIDGLEPHFGHSAILISTGLYALGHYTKPLPEQLGAFLVGTLLGYLGARYKTFYFGILVHYGVAFFMDAVLVVPALMR